MKVAFLVGLLGGLWLTGTDLALAGQPVIWHQYTYDSSYHLTGLASRGWPDRNLDWQYQALEASADCDQSSLSAPTAYQPGQALVLPERGKELCWQVTDGELTIHTATKATRPAQILTFISNQRPTIEVKPADDQDSRSIVVSYTTSPACSAATAFADQDILSWSAELVSVRLDIPTTTSQDLCFKVVLDEGLVRHSYYLPWTASNLPVSDQPPEQADSWTPKWVIALAGLAILGVTVFAFFGDNKPK